MSQVSKKKENRGGKRPGAGRKPQKKISPESFSAEKLQELNNRIEKYAQDEGVHIDEVILRMIYDSSVQDSSRIRAYETIKKYSSIQASEGGEADKVLGPAVYLPEQDMGEGLTVINGGKNAEG